MSSPESRRLRPGDFPVNNGYDFIVPNDYFNNNLGVICSWGVRLNLNLLSVSVDTIREIVDKR